MDWWQYILLYLGIWVLGFFSGLQAGVGTTLLKLSRPQQPPMPGGMPFNPEMLTKMMNSQAGGPR